MVPFDCASFTGDGSWRSACGKGYRRLSWKLPTHPVKPFTRNPLAAVIVQLRFHPILKIEDRVPDFQERVRARFPAYETAETQVVETGPSGIQVRNERGHVFRAPTEPIVVSLGSSAVSLQYAEHKDRTILLEDVATVMGALNATYSPISPIRLGLRYVNVVDRGQVSAALNRSLAWEDLISSSFASVPAALTDLDEKTAFAAEVSSPCSRGIMTVRYGLLRDVATQAQQFRLDTDRFIEADFTVTEISPLLTDFSSDIFQVFMTAAGPALTEWMAKIGEGS